MFRMVVDGLRKHLGGICSEDLFRCCNVPSINEIVAGRVRFPNSYRSIPDRQELEYLLLKEKAYRSKLGFFGLILFIFIILFIYILSVVTSRSN